MYSTDHWKQQELQADEKEPVNSERTDSLSDENEKERKSKFGINYYLEIVDPEIKEMCIETLGDDPEAAFGSHDDFRRMMASFLKLLAELRPKEQLVVALRSGLITGEPMPLVKVAEKFGISTERVRQIERKALLRSESYQSYRRKKIRDFL